MSSPFTFCLSFKNITMGHVGISLKAREDDGDASSSASDDDDRSRQSE